MPKMEGDVPENVVETNGEVSDNLLPTHSEKTVLAMKAYRTIKHITMWSCVNF